MDLTRNNQATIQRDGSQFPSIAPVPISEDEIIDIPLHFRCRCWWRPCDRWCSWRSEYLQSTKGNRESQLSRNESAPKRHSRRETNRKWDRVDTFRFLAEFREKPRSHAHLSQRNGERGREREEWQKRGVCFLVFVFNFSLPGDDGLARMRVARRNAESCLTAVMVYFNTGES